MVSEPFSLSTLDLAAVEANIRPQAALNPGPAIPDGFYGWGYYDAVNYSPARASRPFFCADSSVTLTSWSRLRAMALSRWAYINVPVVKGAVDLMARLTVGTGFTPSTRGKDKGITKLYDAVYNARAKSIGFAGGESMDELLLHDCRATDIDGDLGYVMTEDESGAEKMQLIEGHRITSGATRDTRCIDGVWVDTYARKCAYEVLLPGDSDATKTINARDFIYLAERNRPDEIRSMTALIHALNPLQDLYEIIAFATASAKKNAETGLVIETDTPNDLPTGAPRGMQVRAAIPAANGNPAVPAQYVTYEQVTGGGGKVAVLRPGEKLNSFNHSHPSPTIEAWSEFIIRGIASGYGLPFEILWNPENIGGANTRMMTALLRARLAQRRATLIFPKLNRARFWILARAIKRGDIPFDPCLFNVDWNPNFIDITVDAGRESRERRANVLAGTDTFTSYCHENGGNYLESDLPTREEEMEAQCAAAARLAAKYPELGFSAALARIALLTMGASEGNLSAKSSDTGVAAPKK